LPGTTIDTNSSVPSRFGRAMLLRCPRCGGSGILHHWFKMKEHCPTCGLALERGEEHDYWLGAYAINLFIAEGFSVVVAITYVILSWPRVNWTIAGWIAGVLAVASPIVFFPFSRVLWLAWDLSFRPREEGD
jgi:uncharacterized protein (DUF983 family)